MKHRYKLLLVILALPLFSSVFLVDCKKPHQGTTLTFDADVISQAVAMQFIDLANPNAAPQNITMTISGKNADDIYEISGKKVFNVVDGTISVGIGPSITPTATNPVEFDVNISAPGYMPIKVPVSILPGEDNQVIKVTMINIAHPPSGVTITQQEDTLSSTGATSAPITVSSGSASPGTSLSIPAGTTFKNANGDPIVGTKLASTMAQFSAADPNALSAFPGGLVSKNIVGKDGNTTAGAFKTAGFMDITMGVDGQAVKQFNNPINVSMAIDPTLINPATGTTYKDGDVLSVYSYQVETGIWKYEADYPVTTVAGVLTVPFTTPHLTAFTCATVSTVCSNLSTLNFSVPNLPDTNKASFYMEIYAAGKTNAASLVLSQVISVGKTGSIMLENTPTDAVDIYVYKNTQKGTALGTLTNTVLCGATPTVTVNIPANQQAITFDLYGYCKNANKLVRPTGVAVYYRTAGSSAPYDYLGTIKEGKFSSTDLVYKSTYDFKVTYNSVTYLKTRTVDSVSYNGQVSIPVNLEGNLCN